MQTNQESRENNKRALSKSELSMQYNSTSLQATANRILRRWISQDPDLLKALKEKNYNKHCHLLTPIQVETIYDHLGKP